MNNNNIIPSVTELKRYIDLVTTQKEKKEQNCRINQGIP